MCAYQVIDAYGSVISVESSIVSGGAERQNITIASFLTAVPTTFSGSPSISGTVVLGGGQSSVSGVGIFNTNHIGNGSILTVSNSSIGSAVPFAAYLVGAKDGNGNLSPLTVMNNIPDGGSGITTISTGNMVYNGASWDRMRGNTTGNFITTTNTSVIVVPHSVATLQGTNPWVIGNSSVQVVGLVPTTSVIVVPGIGVLGSVATLQGTTPWITTIQANSIAGTYAEDVAHVDGQRGLFMLGVRNDMVTSFVSADRDYTPIGVDSFGRTLVKAAPEEARIQSVISATAGTTSLLAAGGTGLRTYITDAFLTNVSSNATLVSFIDGDNSVMGRTIAPATGGSNMVSLATPMRTGGPNQIVQVVMSPITSTLGVTALGYKAP